MSGEYKISFEDFDKSKITVQYTRMHYGTVTVDKTPFKFCVYESFVDYCNYLSFSLNFLGGSPGNAYDVTNFVISKTKEKLNLKTK